MKKITKEQRTFLKTFKCVRLSDKIEYDDLTINFKCSRNENIVAQLQNNGWKEDKNGIVAHYLIVHNEMAVVYFALKAGSLFSPLERNLHQLGTNIIDLWKKESENKDTVDVQFIVKKVLENSEYNTNINLKKACKKYDDLNKEIKLEENSSAIQVAHTYAGIELVNFCVNDHAREMWNKSCIMNITNFSNKLNTLGKTMFWYKIVPYFFKVRKLIGCQYCFLFAADSTVDATLVNYYSDSLKFSRMSEVIGTTKPAYDFQCIPMFCEISKLEMSRKQFFDNFNLDDNSENV